MWHPITHPRHPDPALCTQKYLSVRPPTHTVPSTPPSSPYPTLSTIFVMCHVTASIYSVHDAHPPVLHECMQVNAKPTAALQTTAVTCNVGDVGGSLDASTSSDTDGTISAYEWDDSGTWVAGTSSSYTYTCGTADVKTVKLRVKDNAGAYSEVVSATITVSSRLLSSSYFMAFAWLAVQIFPSFGLITPSLVLPMLLACAPALAYPPHTTPQPYASALSHSGLSTLPCKLTRGCKFTCQTPIRF